jgi:hypothetical protein
MFTSKEIDYIDGIYQSIIDGIIKIDGIEPKYQDDYSITFSFDHSIKVNILTDDRDIKTVEKTYYFKITKSLNEYNLSTVICCDDNKYNNFFELKCDIDHSAKSIDQECISKLFVLLDKIYIEQSKKKKDTCINEFLAFKYNC